MIRLSLLFLWLFAVSAPSAVALFQSDKPVVINNLNEEEPLEEGKNLPADEFIFNGLQNTITLLSLSKKSVLADFYLLGHQNSPLEILLPPPKRAI